jgi:predicted nucleic acid-binding Zn ribbon protein
MDIKTVILAIPFSIVARYLATKAGAQIIARWPVLQGVLPWARLKENIMLKINFIETSTEERWILHGRLTDAWVHELKRCWKKHHRTDLKRACIVDLNEVTFIDKCGERLLRMLARDGVEFVASGIYIRHVLDEITAELRQSDALSEG